MKYLRLVAFVLAALAVVSLTLNWPEAQASPGATWTDPAALNTNAGTDSGGDGWPQVSTDGAGNWVAVWESNRWHFPALSSSEASVSGDIGTDGDILYATELQPAPVGGIAELPDVARGDSSARNFITLAGLMGVALVSLTAGACYARRRWGR